MGTPIDGDAAAAVALWLAAPLESPPGGDIGHAYCGGEACACRCETDSGTLPVTSEGAKMVASAVVIDTCGCKGEKGARLTNRRGVILVGLIPSDEDSRARGVLGKESEGSLQIGMARIEGTDVEAHAEVAVVANRVDEADNVGAVASVCCCWRCCMHISWCSWSCRWAWRSSSECIQPRRTGHSVTLTPFCGEDNAPRALSLS